MSKAMPASPEQAPEKAPKQPFWRTIMNKYIRPAVVLTLLLTIITGLAMLASLAWWLAVPRYRSSAPIGIAMVGCAIAWLACSHWLPYWAVWVGVFVLWQVLEWATRP